MNPLGWIKANPLYAAGGAGAVGLGLIAAKKHKSAGPAAGTLEAGSTPTSASGAPYDSTSSDTYNALEGMIENLQSQIDNGGVTPTGVPLAGPTDPATGAPTSSTAAGAAPSHPAAPSTAGHAKAPAKKTRGRNPRAGKSTSAKGRRLPTPRPKGHTGQKLPLPPRPHPVVPKRTPPGKRGGHKPQPSPKPPAVIYHPPQGAGAGAAAGVMGFAGAVGHPTGLAGIGSGGYIKKAAAVPTGSKLTALVKRNAKKKAPAPKKAAPKRATKRAAPRRTL